MVCTFHAVCTRHPETIHASGSAHRNNSSAMASLTGLRSAAARKSCLSMVRAFVCGVGRTNTFRRHCELRTGLGPTRVNETGAELAAGWAVLPDRALMVGLVAVGKRSVAH